MSGHAVCTAHQGRHGVLDGRCVLMGADVPRPFTFRPGGVCADCGASLDVMRARGERRAMVVLAGTTTPHRCRRPAVDLDADTLAEAIVRASRAARQDRPPQQPQTDSRRESAVPAMARNGLAPALPPTRRVLDVGDDT